MADLGSLHASRSADSREMAASASRSSRLQDDSKEMEAPHTIVTKFKTGSRTIERAASFPNERTYKTESRPVQMGYSLDSRHPVSPRSIFQTREKGRKYLYGWWCLTPFCLQRLLNNAKAFVFFVTLANVLQGIIMNGLLKVNVTSIERRYKLLSSESGLIISSYDIAGCLCLLPISYIGGRGHKPRWISVGVLLMGVGSFVLAMPRFLAGPYRYDAIQARGSDLVESQESVFCRRGGAYVTNGTNRSGMDDFCSDSNLNDAYLKQMKYVFILGQFLNGIGNTPLGVLAVTFIDENVDKRVYPIYIGIYYLGALIGPAFGFVIGGQLLTVFTNLDETPENLTPESPMWVGAWWVGFIIAGTITIILSIPLFGYPRKLNAHSKRRRKQGACYSPWWWKCCTGGSSDLGENETHQVKGRYYPKTDSSTAHHHAHESSEFHAMLSQSNPAMTQELSTVTFPAPRNSTTALVRDFFHVILSVLSNKAFIFLSLSAAIYGTLVSGFSTFGPKFIESQLGKSAADAANLFGYVCIPAGAGGMLIGAFLMTGLKMNHKTALQMCIGVSVSGLLAHFVLVLNCDDLDLAGITVPYQEPTTGSLVKDVGLNITSSCNANCACSNNSRFNPICGSNGVTYFSPCHAGCTRQWDGEKIFQNCSCIASEDNTSTATPGRCSVSCVWQNLILFSLFIVIFTTFMCTVPGVDLSLRCFPYNQRPLAVGVQWVLIRTLGMIPGPIIFGAMIDGTCLSWGAASCNGSKGACLMYRNSELSSSFLLLSVIYKGAGIVALCLALVYIKKDAPDSANQTQESKIVELPMNPVTTSQQSTSRLSM